MPEIIMVPPEYDAEQLAPMFSKIHRESVKERQRNRESEQ
ncbi:hypothetical protein M1M34_gp086 [Haloarcula tailed virus 2]|uniref:Uncharacterized protein n=1 Tax=Haloarcula tailed virus 2 TaxID=2877989 RepID=A0AAE8XZL8_9CAUD|nr:hypothetical protein M1M34_gp086 [Haloarcula tailed virus 2]UBF23247.1 hypothetical protein HATV-2_gp96 [Haloarcula tailed virus 2]